MKTEERFAARLVERFGLRPPIDVEALARKYADVTAKNFPIDIDGLCLDLKAFGKRPKIWISSRTNRLRRRFTLAHEIGHIIIPWHIGSIADELDAANRSSDAYRFMEAEANRFAAELLMPSKWMHETIERSDHIAGVLTTVHRVCDVSFETALYRTVQLGLPGYIIGETRDNVVERFFRTRGTRTHAPERGSLLELIDLPTAGEPIVVRNADHQYYCWEVDRDVVAAGPPDRPWREILSEILDEIPNHLRDQTLRSVNSIVGAALGRLPLGGSVDEMYGRVLAVTRNRGRDDRWVARVLSDGRFNQYILGRCYERSLMKPK